MSGALSTNTQAILLLTAPLLVGHGQRPSAAKPLTPSEYKRLAQHLVENRRQPADLLDESASDVLRECRPVLDEDRARRLLERGFLLSQAVERWGSRAVWVVSRADAAYPGRLKSRLRDSAPAVLYGCGEASILGSAGLAVVGSRMVDDDLVAYASAVGRLTAEAGRTLVSGGARGVDLAAMRGALEAGGRATGVLADSLERSAMSRDNRQLLLDGQLVIVSPNDPNAGFNVGNAMQRNKLIYALADAALVVNSDKGKGGTWAGAIEQLENLRLVPVYVRSTGEANEGLEALRKKGALLWPNPGDAEALDVVLRPGAPTPAISQAQSEPLFREQREVVRPGLVRETSPGYLQTVDDAVQDDDGTALDPADELFRSVRKLTMRMLDKPRKADEVASGLGVTKRQAEAWLRRLLDEGVLETSSRPVGYVVRQGGLFAADPTPPGQRPMRHR
jgi:DNA processing protein